MVFHIQNVPCWILGMIHVCLYTLTVDRIIYMASTMCDISCSITLHYYKVCFLGTHNTYNDIVIKFGFKPGSNLLQSDCRVEVHNDNVVIHSESWHCLKANALIWTSLHTALKLPGILLFNQKGLQNKFHFFNAHSTPCVKLT